MEKSLRVLVLSAFFGAVLTLLFFLPLLSHMSTHLSSREDGVLIAYLIHWVSSALLHHQNIFQVPFFYPYKNTLAYSDPFLSTALLNIPILFLTQNIVLANNVHLLLGTCFLFVGTALLSYELTDSLTAAFFTAITFTFSFFHFEQAVHLQTYLFAGTPFCIYFFLRWVREPRNIFLVAAALSFLYQALNSPMTGYFLVFMMAPFLLQKNLRQRLLQNKIFVAVVTCITVTIELWFYWPYVQVSKEFNYFLPFRDTPHFAQSLNIFFHPQIIILFALLLIFWIFRKPHQKRNIPIITMILIGAVCMLGPVLKFNDQTIKIFQLPIPLPYFLAYYVVPGFKSFVYS